MRWMSPSPGTPCGASLNSRKVTTELGLPSSSPKYVWYRNVVSKLSVFLTNRSPMIRHQKSTLAVTSRVTPVKWCGPLSGCFMRTPPRSARPGNLQIAFWASILPHPPRPPMNRSTDRILTTHVGSLPRPAELIRTMFAKQEGVPVDPTALEVLTREAVASVVAKQQAAGVDFVSDGEMSKPSYVTYISDRLDGFGGTSQPLTYADLVEFPALQRKVFGDPGRSRRKTPACTGPIGVRDPDQA